MPSNCTTRRFSMPGHPRRFLSLLLMMLAAAISAHAADSCQPVFDALTKVVTTPSHSYTTHAGTSAHGGAPTESETIYVDGKVYIRARGRWMQSPVTAAEV